MIKSFKIPFYSISGGDNKKAIEKAIILLGDKYLIDSDFMDDEAKIELLEAITNLTNIYLNIEKVENN